MTTKHIRMDFLLSALVAAALLMTPATPADATPTRADEVVEGSPLALEASDPADSAPAHATHPNASSTAAEAVLASTSSSLATSIALGPICDDYSCAQYCIEQGFNSGACIGGLVCFCH